MEVTLSKAVAEDAAAIHEMQTRAFLPLLEKYQDYGTNPANETVDRVVERLNQACVDYYIIRNAGVAAGSIRVKKTDEQKYWLGQIFILPEYQGQGIAQQVFNQIERIYADAKSWGLATIVQEERNCYLYEKLGYRRTGETKEINDKLTLCFYEKTLI
ncbi:MULTISPECIES: GNAT family N-acetyltransferase [unclassified Paenibacillus]|jgi:GNAT superfamily N-acetyltransferase|uniref:GNAT family N-acetyltransferase n=1 Tax=unclassified Paenibacillus TaxID=185978 RepID=UPI0004F6DC4A|nr:MULTISPECIES: GNAT family N-acetyltransferase [unclassified Paenibacillus]AIQ29136.1 acetyltransferase [Paenibacillus sp. FSL P4-0081]OMF23985.1 GNAT family N-acetyltransferase [Paenibacillus sp. FSL H8-0259]